MVFVSGVQRRDCAVWTQTPLPRGPPPQPTLRSSRSPGPSSPCLHSSFPLAVYFTRGGEYTAVYWPLSGLPSLSSPLPVHEPILYVCSSCPANGSMPTAPLYSAYRLWHLLFSLYEVRLSVWQSPGSTGSLGGFLPLLRTEHCPEPLFPPEEIQDSFEGSVGEDENREPCRCDGWRSHFSGVEKRNVGCTGKGKCYGRRIWW